MWEDYFVQLVTILKETDSPLILTFYLILPKLEAIVDGSGFDISSLEGVAEDCVGLLTIL